MYNIKQTDTFEKKSIKFFKRHRDLVPKFKKVIEKLRDDPFESSLKTHKLKGNLSDFYACSLTYQYRIILTIEIKDEEIVLVNIGTHDNVY
ncbi:HigB toxin protein [hydrothermal vent metagenome]|uniref:HigB toxin protein n=1 Tax=hydrothermal vent metagenome TaxID=652676 RepID=A0A1W1CTP5_9ZZZZ